MAVDYFLKIDGVPGESADAKHKGEIQLESFSWGASQTGTMAYGGGGGAGKVDMQDFHCVKQVDKASPVLFNHCATGEHLKKALLTMRKAGKEQQEFMKWTFNDLLVTSYTLSGSNGAGEAMEQISMNFTKISVDYAAQKADGTLEGYTTKGYDIKANKAF